MSFSEMMSSARGPGVIGTLMALGVMAIFVILFIFAFDERFQGGAQSIQSVIAQQAMDIDSYQSNISDGQKVLVNLPVLTKNANELARLIRQNDGDAGKMETMGKDMDAAKAEVANRSEAFEAYKDRYRQFVRSNARGEIMESLETQSGAIYKNVNIREVTAVGIQIRHDEGQRRIPYEELPESMQDRFQFDAKQKAAALTKEQELWNEHESAVAASKKQTGELATKSMESSKVKQAQMLVIKEARATNLTEEIRLLEMAILREGQKGISRAPEMRERLAAKQRELSALRSDLTRMRAAP
jgi:hypothetical protein